VSHVRLPSLLRDRDLRTKLLFTLAVVVLFRFGLSLPAPGVNPAGAGSAAFFGGPLNTLSGGALPKLSVFALGIYPYVLASAVMAVLAAAVPRLGTMATEGGPQADRFRQYTRILAAGLAAAEAAAVVAYAATVRGSKGHPPLLEVHGFLPLATIAGCLAAGAVAVMWLAEAIAGHGFGPGYPLLIATQIVVVVPGEFWDIARHKGVGVFVLALVVTLFTIVFKIFFDRAERHISLGPNKVTGRRRYGSAGPYLTLKLSQEDTAISDATGVLLLAALVVRLWPGTGWLQHLEPYLHDESNPWYLTAYLILIVLFTFANAWVSANPAEQAERLSRTGMFIPGFRPLTPTRRYLSYLLARISVIRAFYLAAWALIPILGFAMLGADASFPFGGEATVLLLSVSVEMALAIREAIEAAEPMQGILS
jgi:preprotein translocase subunit SecY